jgi:hypothetical protein
VIAYSDRGALMSQTELGHRGYRTAQKDLPEPMCCYRSSGYNHAVVYTWLYDPARCVLKKQTTRPRLVQYIDSLIWPNAWLPFLEELQQWDNENDKSKHPGTREWQRRCLELGRIASAAILFSKAELEQLKEEYVVLSFSLTAIRPHWGDHRTSREQAEKLCEQMLRSYRSKHRVQPPLSEVGMEVKRRVQAACERQKETGLERMRLELKAKFAWAEQLPTATGSQPPAVQQALF